MSCRRCLRSLARQRRSRSCTVGGVCGGMASQSGCLCRIAPIESVTVSPAKTIWPVRH